MTTKTPSAEDYQRACNFLVGRGKTETQRLKIYRDLFKTGGEACPEEIANRLGGGVSISSVSSRLNSLALMGLAKVGRRGKSPFSGKNTQFWDIAGDIPNPLKEVLAESWFLVLGSYKTSCAYSTDEHSMKDLIEEFPPENGYRIVRVSCSKARGDR